MDLLNSLLSCIPCAAAPRNPTVETANKFNISNSHGYASITEKEPLFTQPITAQPPSTKSPQSAASEILTALLSASKPDPALDASIYSIIHTHRPSITSWNTWYASLAQAVFHELETLVRDGSTHLSGAMGDAFRKASDAVDAVGEFAKEHPLWTAAVVAVVVFGILVLVAPYLLEALGFAELGPVEGSFAAEWQAEYLGAVPKGSLFSYFQRLGMVWKKIVVMQEGRDVFL